MSVGEWIREPESRGHRHAVPLDQLMSQLAAAGPGGRPTLIGIDGRSSSGKSTLAARLRAFEPACEVVHTDDVAWNHSRFGWSEVLVEHVLTPLRDSMDVSWRPDAWKEHGRDGRISVSRDAPLVLIEGVGVGRYSLAPYLDAFVWVDTFRRIAHTRDLVRIGTPGGAQSRQALTDWLEEEDPFLDQERPWLRADITVAGAPDIAFDHATDVVVLLNSLQENPSKQRYPHRSVPRLSRTNE